jgi:hypothetical protein
MHDNNITEVLANYIRPSHLEPILAEFDILDPDFYRSGSIPFQCFEIKYTCIKGLTPSFSTLYLFLIPTFCLPSVDPN